jgi:uncharacterized membrane protein
MGLLLLFLSVLFFVLLIVVFSQLANLRTGVTALRAEVTALTRRLSELPQQAPTRAVDAQRESVPSLTATPPAAPQDNRTVVSQPPKPSRTREEWEALIGGKLLNRIGALALIIGVGFFLKYAFDNNWISPAVRVVLGATFGFSLLAVAARARTRQFEIFAQGLVGAGIAILYLSVYASFNFYHLLPQVLAFVLMGGVTVIAFVQALHYDSFSVSLLGLIGGFLTPYLLSTGQTNTVGLFSYLALLVAGLLIVAYRRPGWSLLAPLTVGATAVVYAAWYVEMYRESEFTPAVVFLLLLWSLFLGFEFAVALRSEAGWGWAPRILTAATALFGHWALMELLAPSAVSWQGAATFAAAAVFLLLAHILRRNQPSSTDAWSLLGLVSAYFLSAGIALQVHGEWIIVGWAIASSVILWVALRAGATLVPGMVLLLPLMNSVYLVGQSLVGLPGPWGHYLPLLNERALAYCTTIAGIAYAARAVRPADGRWMMRIIAFLSYTWPVLCVVLLTVETNDFFRHRQWSGVSPDVADFQRWLALTVVWAAGGTAGVVAGRRTRALGTVGLGALSLSVLVALTKGVAFEPLSTFEPVLNIRVLALLLVAGLAFTSTRAWKAPSVILPDGRLRRALQLGTALLFLTLATGEVRDAFERAIRAAASSSTGSETSSLQLQNLEQLSLSGVWLGYSVVVMIIGLRRRTRALRLLSITIFGITILKIFFYDLSFLETLYRIFSFIALGLILLVTSYLYQRNRDIILDRTP